MENEKQPIQVEGQPQNQMPTTPPAVKPDNYLVWAILSTLFCCMPFGVISIIYAAQVDNFWAMGQYAIAESTAQKAKKWLGDNKVEYKLRDIKEDNPSFEELSAWYKMSGLPLKKFFNTSGLLYKSMELKDKLPSMTEEEQLKLLATDGMLVKRPLVIGEDFVLVGFKESEWSEKI